MGKHKWNATETTALIAILLGFILEIAPLLLLNVAPLAALASTAPIPGTGIASNVLVGAVFIVFGGFLFWSVRKHKRGA